MRKRRREYEKAEVGDNWAFHYPIGAGGIFHHHGGAGLPIPPVRYKQQHFGDPRNAVRRRRRKRIFAKGYRFYNELCGRSYRYPREKSTEMYEKLAQKDGWERGPLPSDMEGPLLLDNWPELGNITEKNDILWHYEEGEAEGNSWCAILDEEEDTLHFELSYDREKGSG